MSFSVCMVVFFFSSRRRQPICALVTGVQTCALPILGADDRADPACLRGPGDLCRRGFALAQSLLEALERDGETYLAAMAEAVRNGLRHAEHLYRYSFNHMGFDAEIGRAHV